MGAPGSGAVCPACLPALPAGRRWRLLPLQLSVAAGAVLAYLLLRASLLARDQDVWHLREQQLRDYKDIEPISMDFLRSVAVPDHRISKFTDAGINAMNSTELMAVVHSYLDNADILCKHKIRMGYMGDGGWEVCDDAGVRPNRGQCLVYAFGKFDDVAFEGDVERVYNCEVHSFNAYATGDDRNLSSNLQLHSYSLGRNSEVTEDGKELYTFSDIQTILKHEGRTVDVIKLDVGGTEWPSLSGMAQFSELAKVKQLLVKFYLGSPGNMDRLRRALRVLKDVARAGFRKFYAHKTSKGAFHHPEFPVMRAKSYEVHMVNIKYLEEQGFR